MLKTCAKRSSNEKWKQKFVSKCSTHHFAIITLSITCFNRNRIDKCSAWKKKWIVKNFANEYCYNKSFSFEVTVEQSVGHKKRRKKKYMWKAKRTSGTYVFISLQNNILIFLALFRTFCVNIKKPYVAQYGN